MAKPQLISNQHRLCVICEGDEDHAYFQKLVELNVWDPIYRFIPMNAKGASNIAARFQDAYQNDRGELILIFCDTDKAPYREYAETKKKINDFFHKKNAAEKLIIFANPCTMQIILSHFGDVTLKNQGKKTNGTVIERLTDIKDYDAHQEQIKELCSKIHRRSYGDMRERVSAINLSDTTSCSSNFIRFLERFESCDTKWITEIQRYLKSKEEEI